MGSFAILLGLSLIEERKLAFPQHILTFLAGLTKTGSLRIGKDFGHMTQLLFQEFNFALMVQQSQLRL